MVCEKLVKGLTWYTAVQYPPQYIALSARLKASSRLTIVVEGAGMINEDSGAAGGSEGTGSEGSYDGTKVSKSSGAESSSSAAA